MMIFLHFDDFPYLIKSLTTCHSKYPLSSSTESAVEKASEFLNSIITNVAAETGDLLFKESIYLVFFMTATTPPDYPITDFRSITVKNLNLELLEPQEVLNCLLQAFPHHHLLQNAGDPTSEAARTWKIFLTDLGVVPKFFEIIYFKMMSPNTELGSIAELIIERTAGMVFRTADIADRLLRHALTGDGIPLNEKIGDKTLRQYLEGGCILYDVAYGCALIRIPLIFLRHLLFLKSPDILDCLQFPCPKPGVAYEGVVYSTLIARFEHFIPHREYLNLEVLFLGMEELCPQPGTPIKSPKTQIKLPDQSWNIKSEINTIILHPGILTYHKIAQSLDQTPLLIDDGVIYPTTPNYEGIDGFVRVKTLDGKHLYILMQVKSSGSQAAASKRGAAPYIPAINKFYSLRHKFALDGANAILIIIPQQNIPASLLMDPNFPQSGVYAIPFHEMEKFVLPAIRHRFSFPDPIPTNHSRRPVCSSKK